ncbi:hypothetical protein PPL_05384 [Heterostelium album PN500]|uniref:Uncharacterized protein n=1 Tax=Heterostelium pallidum (strain ATCC 26659 / Pp 5 / PN500) TaxID=670386 RepID=D3BA12_HETP5|nr:hypothetical protein PPL_05384 [Heterostelium album PN500]EFA81399.1 hypothetical protein PPL_05384 [Heterostelium album PN500]|eukprot:XP_020433517.1 hypothetical protein PPL_05384 [Heterostelium album PN500]
MDTVSNMVCGENVYQNCPSQSACMCNANSTNYSGLCAPFGDFGFSAYNHFEKYLQCMDNSGCPNVDNDALYFTKVWYSSQLF